MFHGTLTALVTPFGREGALDEEGLRALVARQVRAGVEAVVPCGTTGESPTLSDDEHARVVAIAVEACAGARTRVLAGTGSNDTARTIRTTRAAMEAGADGALIVTPCYNKPTQEGLYAHYRAVLDAIDGFPVVLYNVPSRTGVNLAVDTALRVAALPGVVGLKEASGDLVQVMEILRRAPEGFALLSGDDPLTLPMLALGARGVVSVVSNLVPEQVKEMVDAALENRWQGARRRHYELLPLARALFAETSPSPTKAALARMGLPAGQVRLPLVPIGDATGKALDKALADLRLLPEGAREGAW